jgi:predicted alpha/beta superfamily hydrolase
LKIKLSQYPFLLAKAFRIHRLKRRRKIWAYLPPAYFTEPYSRFPVIYFQDGQNVFEGWKAPFGTSWEAHQTMQQLIRQAYPASILIGIEHGKKYRHGEYIPLHRDGRFSWESNQYADWIANELKEWVDSRLRTLPGREHTAIIGSSLGGLHALYTSFKHQDVFSKAGVFSPSLWAAPGLFPLIKQVGLHYPSRLYLGAGALEGRYVQQGIYRLRDTLLDAGFQLDQIAVNIDPLGRHQEAYWQHEFARFYRWMN